MQIARGITRTVILTKNYALKFPTFRSWKLFLTGLLCNIQENFWWKNTKDVRLCPVLFAIWGGFLVVMPRADPACEPIFYENYEGLPLDAKEINFGYLKNKLVLVDYGS